MRILCLISTLLISACQAPESQHPYGNTTPDIITPHGIGIIYESKPVTIDSHMIDQAYIDTSACTGLSAPPPIIVAHSESHTFILDGTEYAGATYLDDPLIIMAHYYLNHQADYLKHEYIHYLLAMNGNTDNSNEQHKSPLFNLCSHARA